MTEPTKPLLEFPSEFPLKVIGRDEDDFELFVLSVFRKHVAAESIGEVSSRPSGAGTYLSVTVTFTATSQEQIDNLYRELSGHARVVMVL
jgi:putative lipoic acid-binding regulatory protein